MSIDLSYWKSAPGMELDPKSVYQTACCDGQEIEGLEALPMDAILAEIEAAFAKWERMDKSTWEKETGGGFQLFTTPQGVPGRRLRPVQGGDGKVLRDDEGVRLPPLRPPAGVPVR